MKRYGFKRAAAAALCLLLLCGPYAHATDDVTPAYFKDVEVSTGVVNTEVKVNLRREPNTDSGIIERLEPGAEVKVLDQSNNKWVKVSHDGNIGYVSAEFLTISTYLDQVEVINEDPLEASVSGAITPDIMEQHQSFTLEGTVHSNIPMISVKVEVEDMRSLETVMNASEEFAYEADVKEFNLTRLDGSLPFRKLAPGEKQLRVIVESSAERVTVLQKDFYVTGSFADEVSMIGDCKIEVTSGKKDYLTDARYGTAWQPGNAEDTVTVKLPEGRVGALLTIEWTASPTSFTVSLAGESGAAIDTIEENNPGHMLCFAYDLTEDVRQIVISTPDTKNGICELRVMEEGKISDVTQRWQPIEGKVDLMVFSTHEDDELLFFGGTIPYYVAQGKNVVVVYMADCGRSRYAEAMEGLWACGLKTHPIFVGFEDKRIADYEETVALWGLETTEAAVVELIRQYKPDVIVTHDIDGEYGHNQHKLTSYAVRRAIRLAADPESYPTSYEQYGLWDIKKLYIHLYEGNQLTMTAYDEPMEELNGLTPTQVATIAYAKHVSQQKYYTMERDGKRYDNRVYGLIYTTVGDDVRKDDLFENVD